MTPVVLAEICQAAREQNSVAFELRMLRIRARLAAYQMEQAILGLLVKIATKVGPIGLPLSSKPQIIYRDDMKVVEQYAQRVARSSAYGFIVKNEKGYRTQGDWMHFTEVGSKVIRTNSVALRVVASEFKNGVVSETFAGEIVPTTDKSGNVVSIVK